jgi:putative ABC transport system substrate-binding protein
VSRTIPTVFVYVSDPVGAGLIASLARPEGNFTGMLLYEEGIVGKWLAMLKEIAPRLTQVAFLANSKSGPYAYFLRYAQSYGAVARGRACADPRRERRRYRRRDRVVRAQAE